MQGILPPSLKELLYSALADIIRRPPTDTILDRITRDLYSTFKQTPEFARIKLKFKLNEEPEKVFAFIVNPESIEVRKSAQVAQSKTMGGFVFFHWPDLPDELHFSGTAFGPSAFAELKGLQEKFHSLQTVILEYKGKNYRGYFKEMRVTASAEHPGRFSYAFSFVLKEMIDTKDIQHPLNKKPHMATETFILTKTEKEFPPDGKEREKERFTLYPYCHVEDQMVKKRVIEIHKEIHKRIV